MSTPQRLYNEYGSAAMNDHAAHIQTIMRGNARRIEEYIAAHDICPRDTLSVCTSELTSHIAAYTLRRAFRKRGLL